MCAIVSLAIPQPVSETESRTFSPAFASGCVRQYSSSNVTFLGKQDDVAGLLSVADIFLLPSENESFGLSALEAMSCQVPVIGTNAGGLPEVVEHGRTGWLAEVGDVEAMAERGKQLLTDDRLREEMGQNARQVVIEKFHQDKIVEIYEKYYEGML